MQKLLILLLLVLLAGCETNEEEAEALPPGIDESDLGTESFGVEYYFSDSARVTAKMLAAHVTEKEENVAGEVPEANEKTETVHYLDGGVELYFLNFAGRSHSTIKSDSARFQRERGIAKLTGSVVMTNYKGETMNTEELYWDQEKDSVFTDKFVRIETPDKVIIGNNGLRSNSDFTAYTIYGIQGEVETDDP
ncbi:MAG: LPS export ABC transporter periplasmic protein LptC [Bacteroidota bacterium]